VETIARRVDVAALSFHTAPSVVLIADLLFQSGSRQPKINFYLKIIARKRWRGVEAGQKGTKFFACGELMHTMWEDA
jgi:hypothetical protein